MVAERVRDGAGVRTFAAHCHWYFRFPTGLNQGFDAWDTSAIPPGMGDNDNSITSERMSDLALKLLAKPENTSPGSAASASPGDAGAEAGVDGGLDDAGFPKPTAVGTIDGGAGGDRRFFAWFHFFDPHAQYVPHAGSPDFSGPYPAKMLYDQEVWFTDQAHRQGARLHQVAAVGRGHRDRPHGRSRRGVRRSRHELARPGDLGVARPRPARRVHPGPEAAPRLA